MKILLVGNGGREHALAWRLSQSASVAGILCPGGNPGIARHAEVAIPAPKGPDAWAELALRERIDLVVVGPEAPLAEGLADACARRGVRVFGPTQAGARLEASKAFSKEVMLAAGIPTASSETFTELAPALDYARHLRGADGRTVVIKADGLAAGKGVVIATTLEEIESTLRSFLVDGRFGDASRRVVIEEFLDGEEVSVLALTDGESVWPLAPAQDHKRIFDGDRGPNTGGMGAYAPAPVASEEVMAAAYGDVLVSAVRELARRGIVYRGVLYAGLMLTRDGIKVLEFNCRFGDPETQVLMPLFEGDLGETLLACAEGRLGKLMLPGASSTGAPGVRPLHAACVVVASAGYPGDIETGRVINGLDGDFGHDCVVFHAGTRRDEQGRVVTAGGRVLGITAWGLSLQSCLARAYQIASLVSFEGAQLRRDIGARALAN